MALALKKLSQLAGKDAFNDGHVVAYGEQCITWAEFGLLVDYYARVVRARRSSAIATFHSDAVEFAALLVACWLEQKTAVVPANTLNATCEALVSYAGTFVGEFPESYLNIDEQCSCDSKRSNLVVFTSGSQGDALPIEKTLTQLDEELSALESCWGQSINGTVVVGTVSHHHFYGMVFRLLWPLVAGRAFVARARDYWEQLESDAMNYKKISIVSSPAHYKRMPDINKSVTGKVLKAFSSAAPLQLKDALAAKAQLGVEITEIYGSSETGAIASRVQDKTEMWATMPDLEVAISAQTGCLIVRGNRIAGGEFMTSDKVVLQANSFSLLGRADRIVKVAGKRISLTQVEEALQVCADIEQVKVLAYPDRQDRLAAVVVLNDEGNQKLVDKGKKWLCDQLRFVLQNKVEAAAIPRYWRFLAQLPENTEGKITLASLQSLFVDLPSAKQPELLSQQVAGNKCTLQLFIPSYLYYFNGHFPGRPVLPGVVQMHWAINYAKDLLGIDGLFSSLEVIKFQKIIGANEKVDLELEYDEAKSKLKFSYIKNGQPASSGRVSFNGHG